MVQLSVPLELAAIVYPALGPALAALQPSVSPANSAIRPITAVAKSSATRLGGLRWHLPKGRHWETPTTYLIGRDTTL